MEKEILYKYFEGIATRKEEEAIHRWLDVSPANEETFLRERQFFDTIILSGKVEEWEVNAKPDLKVKRPFIRRFMYEFLKIASVILITAGCGLYFYTLREKELMSGTNTITVPIGQRVSLVLPDGTIVWLNARSELIYPAVFSSSSREVTLNGEAYFDVKHNEKSPFIVHTQKYTIEVLGTKFIVEAYPDSDEFSTSLLEGSVRITDNTGEADPILLTPDQEVHIENGKLLVSSFIDYDHLCWCDGLICFKNIPFDELMKRFEKYYGTSILIENKELATYSFSGKFRIQDGLENALRILQQDINYTFEKDEESQLVYIIK